MLWDFKTVVDVRYPLALDAFLERASRDFYSRIKSEIVEESSARTVQSHLAIACEGIDLVLDSMFPDMLGRSDLPFLEIGANDGMTQSNTLFFEMKYGSSGVLVEALPSKFADMVRFRSSENHFFNCAAVPFDYAGDWVEIFDNNLMSIADICSGSQSAVSEIADWNRHLGGDMDCCSSVKVPARTLQSVIDESGFSVFSLLSLDVEGFELSVLDGIDFDVSKFFLILIESRDLKTAAKKLGSVGFRYEASFQNGLTHLFGTCDSW